MSGSLPLSLKVNPVTPEVLRRLSNLEAYDFRVITESAIQFYKWERSFAKKQELTVKQFMAMAFLDPGHYHIPEHAADEYWHRMILHTQWYQKFCDDVFGAFYHHTPEPNIECVKEDNRIRTMKLAEHWFGENWPELVRTCTQCRGPYRMDNLTVGPDPATLPAL